MSVRGMSAQPLRIPPVLRGFHGVFSRKFNVGNTGLSSPKAEVRGSNPYGRAIVFTDSVIAHHRSRDAAPAGK
jgi:hypothetical protein